jgi:hypothetical protein
MTLGHMARARYQQGSHKLNRHKMYGVFDRDSLDAVSTKKKSPAKVGVARPATKRKRA